MADSLAVPAMGTAVSGSSAARSPSCSASNPTRLRDLLQDGQSLADVATAQGVDVQTVIDTLVNAAKEHLDEAVTNGRITQEEADAKLVDLTARITEMVNTARPADD